MEQQDTLTPEKIHVFLPLLLMFLALALWFAFQTLQLAKERTNLTSTHAAQDQTVQTAYKMRTQLDVIAAGTKKLADAGNPRAAAVVQELARRGITIDASSKTPSPPQ